MNILRLLFVSFLILFSSIVIAGELFLVQVQDTVIRSDGQEVPAYVQKGVVPIIYINEDYVYECLNHEIRHILEPEWRHREGATCVDYKNQ